MTSRWRMYGIDAPMVVAVFCGLTIFWLAAGAVGLGLGWIWALAFLVIGVLCIPGWVLYLYTTLAGKFVCWTDVLDGLHLRGDEQVLDLGCGRGAVLLATARRLPTGHATGVDLWRTVDQSGNNIDTTRRNAELEDVDDRVTLETGDMVSLPFPDDAFDVVLSSLAIHNIRDRADRDTAITEAVRVLRPGGRLAVADMTKQTTEYVDRLRGLGLDEVERRGLGWRFAYGSPFVRTQLVTATKPR